MAFGFVWGKGGSRVVGEGLGLAPEFGMGGGGRGDGDRGACFPLLRTELIFLP